MPSGDIGYANQRFSQAVSYLALGEGPLRERMQRAFSESVFAVGYENPRPISNELLAELDVFWERGRDLDVATAPMEDVKAFGEELLDMAERVSIASSLDRADRQATRLRRN